MDRDQKTGRRQALVGQRGALGEGVSEDLRAQTQAKHPSKGSHFKLNRILGNLEKSILSQFNHSEKSQSHDLETKSSATTSAKRKQIIHLSQQQAANETRNPSSSQRSENTRNASHQHLQHRMHDETTRRQHATNKDRITSTLKASVVKSTSEKMGKFTLNAKSQPRESPRQPSSHCSSLATSRLSIPPPHANDEARSLNQTILFGNGAMPTSQQTANQLPQLSFDTSTTINPSASIATMNATLGRDSGCQGSSGLRADTLIVERLSANRIGSSPATSARSLPAIGPKPGSQAARFSDGELKAVTSQEEDEESGFATYQSRRALLKNLQQKQTASGDSKSDEKMMLNRMNHFPNLYPGHQVIDRLHQPVHSNHIMTNHLYQNNLMMMPNSNLYRYNQSMTLSSNQVPIMVNETGGVRLNEQSNVQRVPPTHGANMFNQNRQQVSSYQPQHGNIFGAHQQMQTHVQRIPEQENPSNNGQQIYANAPPKPRRYQYYEGVLPGAQVKSQSSMVVSQTVPHQPSASSSNAPVMSMAPIPRHPVYSLQPNQQLVFNHRGQLCQPQVSYPSMLRVGFTANHPPSSDMTTARSIAQYNNEDYIVGHQQYNGPDRAIDQPTRGFPMMKSKSSLEAGDLIRFKQNRHLQVQPTQNFQQQPLYGYHQGQHEGNQVTNLQQSPNYDQRVQQPPHSVLTNSNLQRSKSVTHLLPEPVDDSRYRLSQLNYRDQYASHGHRYLSSASTNQLNYTGLNHQPQLSTDTQLSRGNINDKTQLTIRKRAPEPPTSVQQQLDVSFDFDAKRNQQPQRQRNPTIVANTAVSNQNQFYRARSIAALNNESVFSNKTAKPGNINASQDSGSRKPSLDDQIKHLLIGGLDNTIVPLPNRADGGMGANNRDINAVQQAFDSNNRFPDTVPSSSSSLVESSTARDIATSSAWTRSGINNFQLGHDAHAIPPTSCPARSIILEKVDSNSQPGAHLDCRVSSSNLSLAGQNADMGNRQDRHCRLNQVSEAESRIVGSHNLRRQSDVNSQLIVDLTTPRVLAKTQTTLLHAGTLSNDSWSLNQVGLPQISSSVEQATSTSQTAVQHVSESSAAHMSLTETNQPNDQMQNPTSINQQNSERTSNLERSAPYYYSDLKSREQREALRNIVQQKSLSPPPQLLSRSTDQSSTRLALRSATLHPGHARTLSDNLPQRQRDALNEINGSKGTLTQSHMIDYHSNSNIAKNIDKLFERPLDNKNSMTSPIARSMLTLDNKESHVSFDRASGAANAESIVRSYWSGNLSSKNISKSKSLDNISQKLSQEEILSARCSNNPVYQNILSSNKLMNAINNTMEVSRGVLNTPARIKIMAAASTNSDESMDSILGSSLEDSDSCSDIIDEIKISSTDNHLQDINNLIEQLKANQSKMAEEYKSTVVRIAKTINSKQDETRNSEKLARRLQRLEIKSRKCESRSKNQLALIQMMENVLRQSRLRALSNRSSVASSQQMITGSNDNGISSPLTPGFDSAASANTTASNSKQASHDGLSSLESQLETRRRFSDDQAEISSTVKSTDPRATTKQNHPELCLNNREPQLKQEIIKAIVVEKEAKLTVMSKATVDKAKSLDEKRGESQTPDRVQVSSARSPKTNAVAKRISDIEARSQGDTSRDKTLIGEKKTNPFCNSTDDSRFDASLKREDVKSIDRSDDDDGGGDASHQDDDDFIEFLSKDNSSHRSQFEASQFSASDFNASTSSSESGTSCGVANDSLISLAPTKRSPRSKDHGVRTSDGSSAQVTTGMPKNRRYSYDGVSTTGGRLSLDTCKSGNEMNVIRGEAHEKFKNVLGNVIDVDICPMNNLSHGCSPVDNQPPMTCSNSLNKQ